MRKTDCTWKVVFWQASAGDWFAICRRYADALTVFAHLDVTGIYMHGADQMVMGDLCVMVPCLETDVPVLSRAVLRKHLDDIDCNVCRCAVHLYRKYGKFVDGGVTPC